MKTVKNVLVQELMKITNAMNVKTLFISSVIKPKAMVFPDLAMLIA
jgi:hypothetical protein